MKQRAERDLVALGVINLGLAPDDQELEEAVNG